jgi:hypothetical protein
MLDQIRERRIVQWIDHSLRIQLRYPITRVASCRERLDGSSLHFSQGQPLSVRLGEELLVRNRARRRVRMSDWGLKALTLSLMTIGVSHPNWANGTAFACLSGS